jgi:hypothetical protein
MHIASGLRRKRDEIAAIIAAYEARIDAARRDLAALNRAARLFDLEAGRDATAIPSGRDRLTKPEESFEPPREARERPGTFATGQSSPPVARTQDLECQLTTKVAHASTRTGPKRIPVEFFYLDWP